MKRRLFFKSILLSALLCCLNFSFAETAGGFALSENVSRIIKKNGFEPVSIPLSSARFEDFPYNIAVDFAAGEESQKTIILSGTEEDFARHEKFFLELLKYFSVKKFPFNVRLLLTAGDEQKIEGNSRMAGTEVFCRDIEGAQNIYALLLDFSNSRKSVLTAGSQGELAPFSLTVPFCSALDRNGCSYSIAGGLFISLYTLGILKSDARLHSFLSRQIPAILFSINGRNNGSAAENGDAEFSAELSAIKDFFAEADFLSGEWSRHYFPVKIGGKRFWAGEKLIFYCFMIFTSIGLFIIADFVFVFRKRSRYLAKIKARAIKSIYLIFATAAILAAALVLGQTVSLGLKSAGVRNPMILYFVKLVPAFFIISVIYLVELKLHKGLPVYVYEYILSISAFFNILIFSYLEISLFFLFALEYLIVMFSRTVKKTLMLYCFMLLSVTPFIPLLYSIMIYSDINIISSLIFCSFTGNIAMAFAMIPFYLVWIRILERRRSKATSRGKLALSYFLAISSCILILASFSGITILLMDRLFFKNVEPFREKAKIIPSAQNEWTKVSLYDSEYYGGKIRHIEIKFLKDAERCSITVNSKNSNPVYFSVYETENVPGGEKFLIPDGPPRELNVTYTPDEDDDSRILIESYFMDGQNCLEERFSFSPDE